MKTLKNILAGFLVSFVGSVPLGYPNVIGYDLYVKSGTASLIPYLIGVIIIEAIVIYATLIFAKELTHNKKLIKYIELFSIFFMAVMAWTFYAASGSQDVNEDHYLEKYINYAPFVIGIICSSLNFIQVPFWTGWNLYLINSNYIKVENKGKYSYLGGTLIGTFCGMLALILFLDLVTKKTDFLSEYLMSAAIPILFLGMALFQAYKFYRKYYTKK